MTAVVAAIGTTGCEPPPPPPPLVTLLVNATEAGQHDVNPGDAVCETGAGNGICTLEAALDEGRQLPRVEIIVPSGTHTAEGLWTPYATSTSDGIDMTVRAAPDALIDPEIVTTDVQAHLWSRLRLIGLDFTGTYAIYVEGEFQAERIYISPTDNGVLLVEPRGVAYIVNSIVSSSSSTLDGVVVNHGLLFLDHSTLWSVNAQAEAGSAPAIWTSAGGRTILRATAILHDTFSSSCSGAPLESFGGNLAMDLTCGLTGPGDIQGAATEELDTFPGAGSARVDANPVGTAGCGVFAEDISGDPRRPSDGNGDGVIACDIGAFER